jgi:hypothetical protein
MDKPLIIALAEAEKEVTEAVNLAMQKNGIPCYLMESIVYKIHRQLEDGKAAELKAAKGGNQNENLS